jgi:putative radical SAM enzyme (TIGR03279 family)
VEPGSVAAETGIVPGDFVVAVNGREPGDILDWQLSQAGESILLTVRGRDGQLVEYEIEKDYDEPLGVVFASPTVDRVRSCRNRCLFCFVDQMPPGMRNSLYIKDDDYRLSFVSGSYITLTNLDGGDLSRIERLHLSPLYVSVHATDPGLRARLLGNRRAGRLTPLLKRLAAAGISFHTQVVVCPGLNDGGQLEKTISDLYRLGPAVKTLAVVPVGLTGHRRGLYQLSSCGRDNAVSVLELVERQQMQALAERGSRFVFASDEFYLLAERQVPADEEYEGYPQLENGIGLVRLFLNDWAAWRDRLPAAPGRETCATVATGVAAARCLEPVVNELNRVEGLQVKLVAVPNRFFGPLVTAAGLLTGGDLQATLQKTGINGTLYLPGVMLKEGKNLFLDGYTVDGLSVELGAEIVVVNCLDDFLRRVPGGNSGVT